MKWIKAIVPVLIIVLLFSGCSFRLASSVDELISPVSPQGDDADIQNALSAFSNGGFTLKTPSFGGFTTAYSFYDLDNDSQEEAVVFYEPAQNPGNINMAVIDKTNENWSVIYNLESGNADIYSLGFSDFNGDDIPEIIVLWDIISNSKSHILSVYSQSNENGEYALSQIGSNLSMDNYISVDMDEDGINEMVVFTVDTGDSVSASATLYSFNGSDYETLGTTKLDGHISYYKSLASESKNGRVYIYADAVKANGNQMLTEIIHWSDYYGTIISPYYSYSTGITKNTTRSAMMTCRDINDDGLIELPLDADFDDLPDEVYAVRWNQYDNSVMTHICYSLAVEKDNYQLVIPDDVFNEISVSYSAENAELTVTDEKDNTVFKIISMLKPHYNEAPADYSEYEEIMSNSGYIYLAAAGSDSDIKITTEDLKSMIKPYEGE